MSPVFGHGRLRLYLLKLLDDHPRHGYEVIRLLQDRFLGVYAPSPGTVYPRLARLEAEGLITHEVAAGRKVYHLTDAGRAELEGRRGELFELEEEITASVRDIAREVREDVRETVRSLRDELTAAAREMREDRSAGGPRRTPKHGRHRAPDSGQDRERQSEQADGQPRQPADGQPHEPADELGPEQGRGRGDAPAHEQRRERRREHRAARDAWREATRKQHDEWRRRQREWHDQARSWQDEWRDWGEEWRDAWEEAWSPWRGDPDTGVRAELDQALRDFVSTVREMARERDLDEETLTLARTQLDETLRRLRRETFGRESP